MILINRKPVESLPGAYVQVPEHSHLQVDEVSALEWYDLSTVPKAGPFNQVVELGKDNQDDLLKRYGIAGRPGKYELHLSGFPLPLRLEIVPNHLNAAQIERMVADLLDPGYRDDASFEGGLNPKVQPESSAEVQAFCTRWRALEQALRTLFAQSVEQLASQQREVSPHQRQRHTPATLARNLRTGRLTSSGQTNHDRLWAVVQVTTLDTVENAFIAQVVRRFEVHKGQLERRYSARLQDAQQSLSAAETYDQENAAKHLMTSRAQAYHSSVQALAALAPLPLPPAWRSFHSPPHSDTNAFRFDPAYARILELDRERNVATPRIQRSRPDDFEVQLRGMGKRNTWQLYEYWLVARVYYHLTRLGFRGAGGQNFSALEDTRGAAYGLSRGGKLMLEYAYGGGKGTLQVEMSVQERLEGKTGERMYPDLILRMPHPSLQGRPLILDAKYTDYHHNQPYLGQDLAQSARRYGQALQGPAGNAMAFLVQVGHLEQTFSFPNLEYWPACTQKELPNYGLREDFPFQYGMVQAIPGELGGQPGEERALSRVLSAWWVRHGLFFFCFGCGHDFTMDVKDVEPLKRMNGRPYNDIDDHTRTYPWEPPKGQLGWLCPNSACQRGIVLNRCHACQQLIVKMIPGAKETQANNLNWLKYVEIYSRSPGGYRHCAACGAYPPR